MDTGDVGADGGTDSVFAGSSLETLTTGRGTGLVFFCLRDSNGTCAAESVAIDGTCGAEVGGVLFVVATPFETDSGRATLLWLRSTEFDLGAAEVTGVLGIALAGDLA